MGLQIYVKMTCDNCKTEKMLENTEIGEFYSDYCFSPEDGWVETFPEEFKSELLCPLCFEKAIKENPKLENTSKW